MPKIESFRDLLVWQKAMLLAERCYGVTRRLPRDHQLVLGHEIRKSCVSVPSNIAEGLGRHHSDPSPKHFGVVIETSRSVSARH
ncbi:MAG: four helix bundle protein [Acidobacteria bacterium]|nr:four helix bundle protein [Acidobacteriota bacterium]